MLVHADSIDTDPGLQSVVDSYIAKKKLTGENLLAFKSYLDTNIQQEYGGAISQLALWYDEDSELPGGDKLVIGGYQNLIGSLAPGLDIALNTVVTEIAYSTSGVTVSTKDGATYTAPWAVVTLPIGVLQANSVKFTPPLPSVNAKAIAGLGSGLLDKVVLVFPQAFWGTGVQVNDRISDGSGAFEEWLSLYPATGLPILVGWNAATYAAALEQRTDTDIIAEAMNILRRTWPTAPDPITYRISRWNSDPFSLGSYSFTTPRMEYKPAHRDVATPLAGGRVQFAGEHTSMKYPATVQGAYWSGQTAACNILKALKKGC